MRQDEMKTDKGMDRINLKSRIVRRLLSLHISQSRRIWNHLSPSTRRLPLSCAFGRHLDRLVRLYSDRRQYFATFFLRNRPELDLLCSLANERPYGSRLNVCVLACSKGAEVYSIAWALRSARPDLKLAICAVDISQEIVEFASQGIYSFTRSDAVALADESAEKHSGQVGWNTSRDQNAWMFERMSKKEIEAIFDIQEETATVRAWLRDDIRWVCGNAGDPALSAQLGQQNIVLANRFLCHMKPAAAEQCLENIAHLVAPGGYLFVSGIDLDVRTKVALNLNWSPVLSLLRDIHEGDQSIRHGWPLEYWGLEPLDDRRPDWQIRYASVFQVGDTIECGRNCSRWQCRTLEAHDLQTDQYIRRVGD